MQVIWPMIKKSVLLRNEIHMGIAVATPDGLTVPVLRNPDQKSVKQIAVELGELSKKAREKKIITERFARCEFHHYQSGFNWRYRIYPAGELASSGDFGYFTGNHATGLEW